MKATHDAECQQAIAALIKGTRSRKRPISLIAVCAHLKKAIGCYGSVSVVAEKISLSESMLRRFLSIEKLSEEMLSLVEERTIDSIDSVAEIAGLDKVRQNQLALCFPDSRLSTEDVRNFVRLSRRFPEMTASQILKTIENARTKKVYSYEFVRRGNQTPESLKEQLMSIVSKTNIVDICFGNALGKLIVTSEGRSEIAKNAKAFSLSPEKLIQHCLTNLH